MTTPTAAVPDLMAAAGRLAAAHRATPEQHLGKIASEVGEAWDAWLGNPRKGRPSDPGATAGELCDVALAALVALHDIAPDAGAAMAATLAKVVGRAAAPETGPEGPQERPNRVSAPTEPPEAATGAQAGAQRLTETAEDAPERDATAPQGAEHAESEARDPRTPDRPSDGRTAPRLSRHPRLDDLTSDQYDAILQRLALLEAGAAERSALLEEARDVLEAAGDRDVHIDDWPAIAPAIRRLVAERDALATQLRLRPCLMPGCVRRADIGGRLAGLRPARPEWDASGWVLVRGLLPGPAHACPDHAALILGHRTSSHEDAAVGATCLCGWSTAGHRWHGAARGAWEEHLLESADEPERETSPPSSPTCAPANSARAPRRSR